MQRLWCLNRTVMNYNKRLTPLIVSKNICFQQGLISDHRCFATNLNRGDSISSLDIFEFMNAIFNGGKGGGINEKSLNDETKLRQVFDKIDLDNSGELDEDEFNKATMVCSMGISDNQISDMFKSIDADQNGTISFTEFSNAIQKLSSSIMHQEEFDKLDDDIKNVITKWDMHMNGNPKAAEMFTQILLKSKELENLVNVDLDRQVHMVFGMMSNTFHALSDIDKLKGRLEKEGTRHFGRFAMEESHVNICGKALFETLSVILGDEYDKKTQQDFEKYWLIVEESLIKGLNKFTF
eukprot:550687_1